MKRNQVCCLLCSRLISLSNRTKHEKSCSGQKPKSLSKEELYSVRVETAKKARNGITARSRLKVGQSIAKKHSEGHYLAHYESMRGKPGRKHSEQSRLKISEAARASGHRRLKRNTYKYYGVLLDSSWELKLAMWLDNQSIVWIRPDPLRYDDNRCYFPDFYLPEFSLFLDTKNDYLIKVDSEKIKKASKQNQVEILILSAKDLRSIGLSL